MSQPARLVRDRVTVLCYTALGAFAFWLYAFGPALALLRTELHFSYALIGVYSAVWAAGAAAVGLVFAPVCRAAGRRRVLWWSALAMTAGAALFTLARATGPALAGAALMGFAGTMLQADTQSVLSDRHSRWRDQALVEANIGSGLCAVAAPPLLSVLQATALSWRAAMAIPALGYALLYLTCRREPLPTPPATAHGSSARGLPLVCWLLAALVAVGIAVEFCVVYFGAELLSASAGLSDSAAVAVMALFYAGLLAGRIAGGALTRRPGTGPALLWGSLAVTAVGFGAFWLSGQPVLAVAGLFVTGAGVANLFPVTLAMTLAAAPGRTDAANGLAQLFGGLIVIIAPFLLGALADQVGLAPAFAVMPVLIALCAALMLAAQRTQPLRSAG